MKNRIPKSKRQKNFLKPLFVDNKQFKRSDINILLNRVKSNQKLELRKKIYSIVITLISISMFAVIFFNL